MERQLYTVSSGPGSRQLTSVKSLAPRALLHSISVTPPKAVTLCSSPLGRPRRAVLVAANSGQPDLYSPGGAPQQQPHVEDASRSAWSVGLMAVATTVGRLFQGFVAFVASCRDVLPQFSVLSPQQALQRMILILAASLLMVVLLTTIDSGLLYVYVRMARRGA